VPSTAGRTRKLKSENRTMDWPPFGFDTNQFVLHCTVNSAVQ
jgi:hypothetical protein